MAIIKYKNAEGNFVPLNNYVVQPITVSLSTGNSTTATMSLDAITRSLNNKVDKVSGKSLSTNDYTTAEKNKLAGIAASANNYSLPKASATVLGGIKVGNNLTIDADGKLSGVNSYTLPKATSSVLGGVKTGSNITNTDGTISITKANVTNALGVDPTTAYVKKAGDTMSGALNVPSIEVKASTPYIDFHYNNSSSDYTARLIQNSASVLTSTATFEATTFRSTIANGTAPITTTSTTKCTNLNADMLDGKHADALVNGDSTADWYGVSWSETSSNPDCTRIGNMDMHRTLPILSAMKPFAIYNNGAFAPGLIVPVTDDFQKKYYDEYRNDSTDIQGGAYALTNNIMVRIPEFWYTDDYIVSTKTHNLKICAHAKPGWQHHKEAYVGAYEGDLVTDDATKNFYLSRKNRIPTVNVTRETIRTGARLNGEEGEFKWNIYTYEEHRAICHLFLVEYATRNSLKAVNTSLTAEGFRQGGLGSGCTTGTATINGLTVYSFIRTGSSDSLGCGSGEVTVTIQQTDSSGNNTTTVTRKCNRYRGIENPFGHVWKHCDDVISVYEGLARHWFKSAKPDQFATNKNASYKMLCSGDAVSGYKTEIKATPTCDFFATTCSGGSENTYWCDYNYDNTDTSEHCLIIGGNSDLGGQAGLFSLASNYGVGSSYASVGSRLTYLPWAE